MTQKKFKDACDNCKQFNYCKGYKGKVLCPDCIKKEEENKNGNRNNNGNND